MAESSNPTDRASGEVTIAREFPAPRELVWKAWTDPDLLTRWWGPKSFTAPSIKIDLRVGGHYLYCMRSPEGQDYWSTGEFLEVLEFERIVYTNSFADSAGNVVPASYYGMEGDMPLEFRVELYFKESDGKTRLISRQIGMPAGSHRDLAVQGWNESLDKLAAVVRQLKKKAA